MKARSVDQSALRTNQAVIIFLLISAYIFDFKGLVYFTALAMLVGSIFGSPAFKFIHQWIVLPFGISKPDIKPDDPNSHRFAQLVGGLFLIASSISLYYGMVLPGWILTFVVIALAAVNLFAGFCVGCFIYYQLGRIGLFPTAENSMDGTDDR